jgi:hypothetical protein
MSETRLDKIGRGKMPPLTAGGPEPRHDGKDERVNDDRVRDREEAIGADTVNEGRHGDYGVGRVKISADEEPGNNDPEPLATQGPFVESLQIPRFPASRQKPKDGNEQKKAYKYNKGDPVNLSGVHSVSRFDQETGGAGIKPPDSFRPQKKREHNFDRAK